MVNISGRSTQGVKRSFKPPQTPKKFLKRYIINAFSCVVLFASNLVLKHLKFLKIFPLSGTFFWSKFSQYWHNFTSKNLFVNSTRLVGKMLLRTCISHYGCSQWDIKQREKKQLKRNLES